MLYHEMWGQHLRLGNFLFKYAWSIAKKEQFGIPTVYPDYYLWQHLKHPPLISNEVKGEMLRPIKWEYSKEEEILVNNILKDSVRNNTDVQVALNFFFQSEKWFENYKDQVWKSLQFKDEVVRDIEIKYQEIFNAPTIGIGIRLGDFIKHGDFYQIDPDWYISALLSQPFWSNYNVVIFSDDIEMAKEIFKEYNFFYAEPNGTHTHADNFSHYHKDASEQFILGTMMDNWIIGNSTFSWFQAWIAEQNSLHSTCQTKCKVIHSGKVFSDTGNMKHVNTEHYYCRNWIKHETI